MRRLIKPKFLLLILIVLILPISGYTILQFTQRNEDEKRIRSIYDRQLNTLLFSVNQHCWDILHTLTVEIESEVAATRINVSRDEITNQLTNLVKKHSYVSALTFKNPCGQYILVQDSTLKQRRPISTTLSRIDSIISAHPSQIKQMTEQAQEGYVRPFSVTWDSVSQNTITLLLFPIFISSFRENETAMGGVFIDHNHFVNDIVVPKFNEMDAGNVIFGIEDRRHKNLMYTSTSKQGKGYERFFEDPEPAQQLNPSEQRLTFEKRETLWILPGVELLIRLQGTTLDQIAKARTQRNLIFITLVNLVLILGIVTLFRNMSREMILAQMKTDFVANVSHELRTPLALIRMYSETLEMGRIKSDKKKREYYRTIMDESARLTQLINNILDFSKIESRKKTYNLQPTQLESLVKNTVNMYRFQFEQKGFTLKENMEKDLPDVLLDSEAIVLVLVNIMDNAIKFSPDDKRIDISLKRQKNHIVLSITDHGIGISESEQNKIFDKFYRSESSLIHDTKGSGLGLSLVKHIMEVHHGRVTVQSKQNTGSTFSLIFPVK